MNQHYSHSVTHSSLFGCLVLLLGCSTTHRNYSDSNAGSSSDAGSSSVGGSSDAEGGRSTKKSATGGKSSSSTSTNPGGSSNQGGTANIGGTSSTPDTSVNGGSGTASSTSSPIKDPNACVTHADCAHLNPDINSCLAKCVAGFCKVEVDTTSILALSSATLGYDSAVTGLWNGSTPYVVFSPPRQASDSFGVVKFQALRADKTTSGAASSFSMPPTTLSVDHISAVVRNDKIALLWHGTKDLGTSSPNYAIQFAETDFLGTAATTRTLVENTVATNYPEDTVELFLAPSGAVNFAFMRFGGTPNYWKGYVGDPATAAMDNVPLLYAPKDTDESATVIENTIFVTGRNCTYMDGACPKHLEIQRYSLTDLSAIGDNSQLSTTALDSTNANIRPFSPAMGVIGSNVVVFWNENGTSELELVRDKLSEAGVYQTGARVTTKTPLIPKAITSYKAGGGVLFAARVNASSTNFYEFVAQRFDDKLNLVGEAYVIGDARTGEPSQVDVHTDSTGNRILVTLRHGGSAKYTLLHAGLCQ